MKTMAELFEHTLKDIYYAENALTKALPKMADAVKSADLKKAIDNHLAETKDQIKKLKKSLRFHRRHGGRREMRRHRGADQGIGRVDEGGLRHRA